MSITKQKITPCLWFDTEAEDAARFYCSVFENAKINSISHYGKEGFEIHGRPAGSVMAVEFEIEGQKFVGLNGGPHFKFDEAVSFQVHCKTQDEVDYFWSKLSEGGQEGPCGWRQGQIRPLLAGRPRRSAEDADGRGPSEIAAGHQSLPEDEKV